MAASLSPSITERRQGGSVTRRCYTAPLARLPRRALPWRGPPGASRARAAGHRRSGSQVTLTRSTQPPSSAPTVHEFAATASRGPSGLCSSADFPFAAPANPNPQASNQGPRNR